MKRLLLSFLAIIVLFSSFPPSMGQAATTLNLEGAINNHTDQSTPLQVFSASLRVQGNVFGADPRDVRVTITQVDADIVTQYGNAPNTIGQDFTFEAIPLFAGLNELAFEVGNTRKVVYVEYVNAPNISHLELYVPGQDYQRLLEYQAQDPFQASYNRQVSFDRLQQTLDNAVNITGLAYNVDQLYINGNIVANNPGAYFTYNLGNIGISKGNYRLQFSTVNNDGSTFNFTYPVGLVTTDPTFLNVALKDSTNTAFLDQFSSKVVNINGGQPEVGTHLYVPKNAENFSKVVLQVRDKNGRTLGTKEIAFGDLTELFSETDYTIYRINETITEDPNGNPINLSPIQDDYILHLAVWETNDTAYTAQTFPFRYVDTNNPYIQDIIIESSGLSLFDNPIIMSREEKLIVTVNNIATGVSMKIGDGASTQYNKSSSNKVTIPLNNLERGNQLFTFTPEPGGQPVEIYVEVVLTPTVAVRGIANNATIRSKTELGNLTVSYLNMEQNRGQTEIYFNGEELTIANKGNAQFTIDADLLRDRLQIGRNTLRFTLYPVDGSTTVVEITFQYLPDNTPNIGRFYPTSAHGEGTKVFQGVPGQEGNYMTMEKDVKLVANILNLNTMAFIIKKNNVPIAKYRFTGGSLTDNWNTNNWEHYDGEEINGITISKKKFGDVDGIEITTPNHREEYFDIGKEFSLLEKNRYGEVTYATTTIYTLEAYSAFDNGREQYPMSQSSMTIYRQAEAFELDGEAKRIVELENGVTNKNYFPFEAWVEKADKVVINKVEAKKVSELYDDQGREKFTARIPLKKGANKLTVEITRGDSVVKSTLEIFFADISNMGSAYREVLGKNARFRLFNNNLELRFPKGVVLEASAQALEENEQFSRLLNESPILFGKANPETGILTESEVGHSHATLLAQQIRRLPNNHSLASDIYWIDFGTVSSGEGLLPLDEHESVIDRKNDRQIYNLIPSSPGELTLSYKEEIRNELNRRLTVLYFDGRDWENIGGILDVKKQTITVPITKSGYYTVSRVREAYQDISNHPWAKYELELLSSRGWMNPSGRSGNNFGAYERATRGEFATMLVKAFNIPLDYEVGPPTFNDVPKSLVRSTYEYKYIETAARVGIVNGVNVAYFDAEGSLTREQAASMIARAANYRLNTPERALQRLGKTFRDAESISFYAIPSVEAVVSKGIMTGKPVPNADPNARRQEMNFDPSSALTRDELAVITYRLLQDQKMLPK